MTDPTQDALHAERIARLTELARKVWSEATANLHHGTSRARPLGYGVNATGKLESDGAVVWHRGDIARAYDALEAALLVLSGEGKVLTREAFHEAVNLAAELIAERRRQSMAELEKTFVPAWVEELASEWDMSGYGRRDAHAEDEAQVYFGCAAELRERAKEAK